MHTIKISRKVYVELKKYSEGKESMDKTVNRLLSDVGSELDKDSSDDWGYININLSKSTMECVKSFQLREQESYDSILSRALDKLG